jgi:hypothetical protein
VEWGRLPSSAGHLDLLFSKRETVHHALISMRFSFETLLAEDLLDGA